MSCVVFNICRFCPAKYYPFDPNNLDKYVVGDDYTPTWKVIFFLDNQQFLVYFVLLSF